MKYLLLYFELKFLFVSIYNIFHFLSQVTGKAFSGAFFGKGDGPVEVSGLRCTGNEVDLLNCRQGNTRSAVCEHSQDAGVSCSCKNYSLCIPTIA